MRKIVMVLTGSTLLTMATLSLPGTASAASGDADWNSIKGTVHSSRGEWNKEDRGDNPRHKTDTDDRRVRLNLKQNVDGGLCVRLFDSRHGRVFTDKVCWSPGEKDATKTVATGMEPGTEFFVEATKQGSGNNNTWSGRIFY